MTRITQIETAPLVPRFTSGAYKSAYGTQDGLRNRLLRLTFDNGICGLGEIARAPWMDAAHCEECEDASLPELNGKHLGGLPRMVSELRRGAATDRALAAAIDCAFHDAVARMAGLPISALLGGAVAGDVPEVLSLSSGPSEAVTDEIVRRARACDTVQIKLGHSGDADADMRVVEAALAALGSDQRLLADFNGALTPTNASRLLPSIDDPRLVWEEPCATYDENLEVARATSGPILLDQCIGSLETCLRAVRDAACWGIVIKPALLGGVAVARSLRDLCAASGLMMRIDGPWSGQIGAAAVLHLGVGAPPALLIGCIDLTEALDTPRELIARQGPGRLAPAGGPGLGSFASDPLCKTLPA